MVFNLQALGHIHDLITGEIWDSSRLAREIARRTRMLASHGIGRGTVVVLAHGGTPEFFCDLFAIWSLGACAACINPKLTSGELANVVEFVGAKSVVVSEALANGSEITGVPIISSSQQARRSVDVQSPVCAEANDAALILFTSGTTGVPKGVVHTFGTLDARIRLNQQHIGHPTLARTLCLLPTHFGHGLIGNCLTPLFTGADLFLYPDMGVAQAPGLGSLIADNRINFMSSVPTIWKIVLKLSKPPAEQTLDRIHIGSAPLSAELWRSVQAWAGTDNVFNTYGITETANWISGASGREFSPEDGLVGRMWGGAAAVMDENGVRRSEGSGELVVQSPSLMKGYYRRDDLTAEILSDGWYHTGDIGTIGADAVIRLTGRQKSEINKGGMKIHPEEIDFLLENHPQIAEACAFGLPDEYAGELVGVAVRLADGASTQPFELKTWCTARIKPDAVPDYWYIVEEIPKTDRGKVNRNSVRDACSAGKTS